MTPERIKEIEEAKKRAIIRAKSPDSTEMTIEIILFTTYIAKVRKICRELVTDQRDVLREIKKLPVSAHEELSEYRLVLASFKDGWDVLYADLFSHLKPFIEQSKHFDTRGSGKAHDLIRYAKETMIIATQATQSAVEIIRIIDETIGKDD